MGSLNRKFSLDHDDGMGLTHKVRLRWIRSQDGTAEGLPLFHDYVDCHSTYDSEGNRTVIDEPITASDRATIRLMAKVAATYGMDGGAILDAIVVKQWGQDVRDHAFALITGEQSGDAAFGAIVEQLVELDALLNG